MDLRIIMIQRIPEEDKMVIGIDRCLPNPENLIGQYVHFTEDPQEVLPSLKDEKQPGELREPALTAKVCAMNIVDNPQFWKYLQSRYDSNTSEQYTREIEHLIAKHVDEAIRSQAESTLSEGSETTGEVHEEPVLDFSASPLNNQLKRPAVKNTRGEDIFTAIITWVAVLLVTCGTLGGLFVFMAWLKAVSISFGY